MGISQAKHINMALLAKWWWRLLGAPENTVCRILKENYENKKGLWILKKNRSGSSTYFWRGIQETKETFWARLKFNRGNGSDIHFWRDKWLQSKQLCYSFLNLYQSCWQEDKSVEEVLH